MRCPTIATMTITMIAIGTNVPKTIVAVETFRGGLGGGVGHQAGLENSVPMRADSVKHASRRGGWFVRMGAVVRVLSVTVLAAVVFVPLSAASTRLSFTFKTRQGPAVHHANPPSGAVGDSYQSTLVLRNAGIAQLGAGRHEKVGSMELGYTIRRQCTAFAKRCVATADFDTVTTLPGGKVLAGGRSISIATPSIRIPVTGGTGRFEHVHGWVTISPSSTRISTYELTLP